jgi:hypothetical protein
LKNGSFHFRNIKYILYKEDFTAFSEFLTKWLLTCFEHKEKVISERHQKILKGICYWKVVAEEAAPETSSFIDIDFDDI